MRQKSDSSSVTTIMKQYADTIFLTNMWKLFKRLFAIPIATMEAEESFVVAIRSTIGSIVVAMSMGRLMELTVIAIRSHAILI